MLVKRSFTYKGRIRVSPTDLQLARGGGKTCTIRLGTLAVEGQNLDLVDGRNVVPVKILTVDSSKVYQDLNDDHAKMEGFESLDELKIDLAKYYGEIDPCQPVTIIVFEKRSVD